jgi:hypothetical protein
MSKMQMSPETERKVLALRRPEQTPDEILEQVVRLGCYQLEYRRQANPKKALRDKEARRVYRQAQQDPELSVKLGLGTRVAL